MIRWLLANVLFHLAVLTTELIVTVSACQDGFTPIGPCVDGLCPNDISCVNNLCCKLTTVPAAGQRNASADVTPATERPLVAEVVVPGCINRGADCAALTAGNRCFNPRLAIRLWRQCQRSCGYCGVTNIRQLASEVRVRQIANGALVPRAQTAPSLETNEKIYVADLSKSI